MRARDVYSLDYRDPPRRSRWIRRAWSAVIAVLSMGEPVAPGGGQVLIADALTGRVLDMVDVSFGDDGFTMALLEEDLLALTADEFAAKWISAPSSGNH